jgi:hypothetical protein
MTYTTTTARWDVTPTTAYTLARQIGENAGITTYQVLDLVLIEVEMGEAHGDKPGPGLLTLRNAI